MTVVIFVHGTGVRQDDYFKSFEEIQNALHENCGRPDIDLKPCYWGETGARQVSKSIPPYPYEEEDNQQKQKLVLWSELDDDPCHEIRRFYTTRPPQEPIEDEYDDEDIPSNQLTERIEQLLEDNDLKSKLEELQIHIVFDQAVEYIRDDRAFENLLEGLDQDYFNNNIDATDQYYEYLARAIVAQSLILCRDRGIIPPMLRGSDLSENINSDPQDEIKIDPRDEAVDLIEEKLTGKPSRGFIDNLTLAVGIPILLPAATRYIKQNRRHVMDFTTPIVGDILLYQSKGEEIRKCIRNSVENAGDDSIVLLAHSLGGIACVDLLNEGSLNKKIACLITVGSQAPYFYEIGALKTLAPGESLKSYFPSKWINIYDLCDFLSFIGGDIFDQERYPHGNLTDKEIKSNKTFIRAHTEYWSNAQTWSAIGEELP